MNEIDPRSERGATALEYALIGIFVALVALIGITQVGLAVDELYDLVAEKF